jgi:hypothetical protein
VSATNLRLLLSLAAIAGGLHACAVIAPQATPAPVETPLPIVEAAPPPPPPAPQRRVSDAERLLGYYEFLLALSPDDLAREQERTMRFYGQYRSEFALMQLVLLRSLPTSTRADRAQAIEMLSSYLKDTKDRPSELRPLALMLTNQLTEQQRQEAEIQTQTVKLREEVKRSEQYKQKLDALVETERKMLERSKPARNP